MAQTPEIEAKIARLTAMGKAVYQAIATTEPPTSLAMAARGKTPYEELSDDDVVALAAIGAELVKAGFQIVAAPPLAAGPAVKLPEPHRKAANKKDKPQNGSAPVGEVVKPDGIIPPPSAA